jgi:DNA-binding NarL/FixJ family response regulator
MSIRGTTGLRGRDAERAVLDRLVSDVRDGRSGVLVIRGEAGIGKTALLDDMCEAAGAVQLVRGAGVESEVELPFAGLHHLCSQLMSDKLDLLPEPQREAIRVAFGESAGSPPNPFLLGLAVLNALADAAEERPVMCVVDDAQWLDRATAQTLSIVARRLEAEAVGIVFAVRDPIADLDGMPELVIEGLAPADARDLMSAALPAAFDDAVRERLIAETHGNPLALLELPRATRPAELAGGFGVADPLGVPSRIEESFRRRCEELPADTRLLMLTAAAEPVGDPVLVWRATRDLGIASEAADPAGTAGLLTIGGSVVFRHPLVRSAVYRMATPAERRRVHQALAKATDPDLHPDRCAWHQSQGAAGPDEDVAAALERSAGRAQARGGLAAAAAFLARAVELTPDPTQRAQRAYAAAQAKLAAGSPAEVSALLAIAEAGPLDELSQARVDLARAQLAFAVNRGSEAYPLLLRSARRFGPLDPRLARDAYIEALIAAVHAGPLAVGGGVSEAARAMRAAPGAPEPVPAYDRLLDGMALAITDGYAAGFPLIKPALAAFRDADSLHGLFIALHACHAIWDYENLDALSRLQVELARDSGALTPLVMALAQRASAYLASGDLASAASVTTEADTVSVATGIDLPAYGGVSLAARRGREADAMRVFEESRAALSARGEGIGLTHLQWASAMLYNSLGRYAEALEHATLASARPRELGFGSWGLVELIEAACRVGDEQCANRAMAELAELTRASGTPWALGLEARSRALVAHGDEADALYREALDHHARTAVLFDQARVHLLYGEWLRREGRRVDAREQLRIAHQLFESFGAEAFAARTAHELAATGERVRKRSLDTADELTVQERQVAELAAKGQSNRQIGEQLFISHRTVGYHLGKVFTKLGIANRAQLNAALP